MAYERRKIGENVLLLISGHYKLAKIERKFPRVDSLTNETYYKYLGHIYHNNIQISIIFSDMDIETEESYEKHRRVNSNLSAFLDFIEDDID